MWTVTECSYDHDYDPMFMIPMIHKVVGVIKNKEYLEIISKGEGYTWNESGDRYGKEFSNKQLTNCAPEDARFIDFKGYKLSPFKALDEDYFNNLTV